MKLNKQLLQKITRAINMTRENELDCQTCFDALDAFAEMQLEGKSPAQAMPLVHEHLERCAGCKDEYLALLRALEALEKL
ncbi:MAG: hypothetical protein ACOC2C_05575 [Cyclonatronaceae bacterium]